ncbi:hypothetical protein HSBGL_0296 [Halapricum desulfuricans]|uniref:Uncharacterized protein n=1 Tax=Halapricum desulfuricans TaxID=2841257 RepID=A0A897NID6_9EURY|nr:hypothetical protein HSBGL_0296 [Halapricum desulfuricans]
MCNSTADLDDLARAVEHTIDQNEAAVSEFDEDFTSFSDHAPSASNLGGMADVGVEELFG